MWDWVAHLNFEQVGDLTIAIFLIGWLISTATYRLKRYDALEVAIHAAE